MEDPDKLLIERAATFDELLSDQFEPLSGGDADLAAKRFAAWRRASANGDPELFGRRLDRDGWSSAEVMARFGGARLKANAPRPTWTQDAGWIVSALQDGTSDSQFGHSGAEPVAFEHLLLPVVESADSALWGQLGGSISGSFAPSARACLSRMLLNALSDLCAPALYERFSKTRTSPATAEAPPQPAGTTSRYDNFVSKMKESGFRSLFEEKPVLLRLIASLTRQWIDFTGEFVRRLGDDLAALRGELLPAAADTRVAAIDGDISDRHNGGRSVLIVRLEDGARVVYKPKDLRLDVAWHDLIAHLNRSAPPVELRAARAIARDSYGWTEFIEHSGCPDQECCDRFFRRAGAWLALFHCFAATDMHQENVIAAGDHPVPIDLETILQSAPLASKTQPDKETAQDAAADIIANSVMTVGLLPAYGRAPDNSVFAMGGLTADWNSKVKLTWNCINTDEMRPSKTTIVNNANPNLPYVGGRYARYSDHLEAFIAGFEDYARFLEHRLREAGEGELFAGFEGLPIRKVVRPTRFYSMLLQRLKNHRSMDDGATWSAQADFIARLADWQQNSDAKWPFHHAERAALVSLNVPHFVSPSDGNDIGDTESFITRTEGPSGLERARTRARNFDAREIAWQTEVIRANSAASRPTGSSVPRTPSEETVFLDRATDEIFIAEADRIAAQLSNSAIRRGTTSAWIGLDWLGDAEVYQLVVLGPDLYNGAAGIGVFLAAHAVVAENAASADLALAGISNLRTRLKDRNAARFARSLGIGGAAGLGSIVYALSVMSKVLRNDDLLADAHAASRLMTDELLATDKRLDVIGGSAGAILALLRLYRDTGASDVLDRALSCGHHLMRQERVGPVGCRTWVGQGFGTQALNGMSHGASGFALALASLAMATGREEFQIAASECLAFENSSYDAGRHNWPDLRREGEPGWPHQWCHGAPGIGLARAALLKLGAKDAPLLQTDLRHALAGVEQGWRGPLDTLCCGTLGSLEFFCEAGDVLDRPDIRKIAAQRLAAVLQAAGAAGDYRWNSGQKQFNLGMFRGLAGVGYTLLRQVDGALPNILVWE